VLEVRGIELIGRWLVQVGAVSPPISNTFAVMGSSVGARW
jgi:hypothetical protein